MIKTEDLLKFALLQIKESNKGIKTRVESFIREEETNNSSNKEEALNKLRECLYCIGMVDHLCDMKLKELEKSPVNYVVLNVYSAEIDYVDGRLKTLINDYLDHYEIKA